MVDDFTSPCDIANVFASKYQDLYTRVKFYKAEMDVVRGDIQSSDQGFTNYCIVTFKKFRGQLISSTVSRFIMWAFFFLRNSSITLRHHVSR